MLGDARFTSRERSQEVPIRHAMGDAYVWLRNGKSPSGTSI